MPGTGLNTDNTDYSVRNQNLNNADQSGIIYRREAESFGGRSVTTEGGSVKKAWAATKKRVSNFVVKDFLKFGIPLTWTHLRVAVGNWNYCDNLKEVGKGMLFVGAIPLKNNIDNLIGKMLKVPNRAEDNSVAFLSVVEPHETVSGKVFTPALKNPGENDDGRLLTDTHRGIKNKKGLLEESNVSISNLHCPEADFGGNLDTKSMKNGVEFIKGCVDSNKPIYIHCKAGRSRSVTYTSAYLMMHEFDNVQKALSESNKQSAYKKLLHDNGGKEGGLDPIVVLDAKLKDVLSYMKSQRVQVDVGKGKKSSILLFLLEEQNKGFNAEDKEKYMGQIQKYYGIKPKKTG